MAAFTSKWVWESIDRSLDISVGAVSSTRNNWSVVRSRYSDKAYVSELGASEGSLDGENGGVTETIETGVEIHGVKFDTTRNWVLDSTLWIDNGNEKNGNPVYVQYLANNIPNAAKVNVIYLYKLTSYSQYYWVCTETTAADVNANTMLENASGEPGSESYFVNAAWANWNGLATGLDNENFNNNKGTFSGSSRATEDDYPTGFVCESDRQTYTPVFVDWYKQTQRWVFKTGWTE